MSPVTWFVLAFVAAASLLGIVMVLALVRSRMQGLQEAIQEMDDTLQPELNQLNDQAGQARDGLGRISG